MPGSACPATAAAEQSRSNSPLDSRRFANKLTLHNDRAEEIGMKLAFWTRMRGLIVALLLPAGCAGGNGEPATNVNDVADADDTAGASDETIEEMEEMDLSTSRSSENDLFQVSYASDGGAIPMNELHIWTLHMETAAGQPVEDATISVDGGMPNHGHGLPTEPAVTEYLGDGDYRVEGLKFQMAALWETAFTIDAGDDSDTVVFHFMVSE
jgi:hypothetical protein